MMAEESADSKATTRPGEAEDNVRIVINSELGTFGILEFFKS